MKYNIAFQNAFALNNMECILILCQRNKSISVRIKIDVSNWSAIVETMSFNILYLNQSKTSTYLVTLIMVFGVNGRTT